MDQEELDAADALLAAGPDPEPDEPDDEEPDEEDPDDEDPDDEDPGEEDPGDEGDDSDFAGLLAVPLAFSEPDARESVR
nr:hypothetical protein [Micromonospora sp. NBS 11-29]